MNEYSHTVKEKLLSLISEMSDSLEAFVKNPAKDFTRNRKLPFETVVKLLIAMGGNSIYKELLESTGYDLNTATASAFVQQRDKILPFAFESLFHKFTDTFHDAKTYHGYRLLAADGSDLYFAVDPDDPDTYLQTRADAKGYNILHLNALYDLCNRLYVDASAQPTRCSNEKKAIVDMVDRSRITEKTIVIADRYYESYNIFAHIERKGWNYLIRAKDIDSNGILSGLSLPSGGEFDICVHRILTRRHTNEIKARPDIYRFLSNRSTFDFLDLDYKNQFYPISFRIVRLKIADNFYETLITNLHSADFSPTEIKALYNRRWGIETSFRELKYSVGLTNFHAKKREYILQEIFARLIMYNFAEMITSHVVISQADTKFSYQVNFTAAIHICRYFLRLWSYAPPPDVEALIRKIILPVRPGRKDKRKIRCISATSFLYRVA